MTPQTMTYGFARGVPFAQVVALATLLVASFTDKKQKLPFNALTGMWLALVVWMSITSLFSMAPPGLALDRWIFVMKIQLMMFVSLMLVRTGRELRILVIVVTMSLAYFGIKGGIFTLMTGGGARVWGPGASLLGGNNELAVGLVMIVPFLYWMRQTIDHKWGKWIKIGLTAAIVLSAFAILGTQSRGALIALLAIALFLGAKSAKPVPTTLGICALVVLAIAFMPSSWNARMDTIKTYEEDGSAMSRLYTWRTLTNAALDRPLVGAGFRADNRTVFAAYAPTGPEWENFKGRIWVAHSIYFQMLGEHGFVGLGLFLAFWGTVWRRATRTAREAMAIPDLASWLPLLMRMSQVSLVGFAAGGAFLSLAYLDLTFYFAGYVLLGGMLVAKARAAPVAMPAEPSRNTEAKAPRQLPQKA
ncbi:MAG: putative O-glycosylation ligase, exosortase A system-associated [Betaproteobacteria bacterium]|nr:putative O-glycosylation ligase, exosortase A system-associated [Betaproteobacteria bacterium]